MALRNIRKDGDEILTKRSREVDVIDDRIRELVLDMFETMHKYDGLGLAAVQVGVLKRVIVIDLYEEGKQFVLINPEILEMEGEQIVEEGCLSFPDTFGKVKRALKCKVKAIDLEGKEFVVEGEGLLAQAFQHEIDHLNGEVFIKKVLPGTLEKIKPEKQGK